MGIASLLITNAASLLVGMGIYVLARSEFRDKVVARRAVWLIMLAPPAFVFVMGYSEALLVLLAVAFFVAIRRSELVVGRPLRVPGRNRPPDRLPPGRPGRRSK